MRGPFPNGSPCMHTFLRTQSQQRAGHGSLETNPLCTLGTDSDQPVAKNVPSGISVACWSSSLRHAWTLGVQCMLHKVVGDLASRMTRFSDAVVIMEVKESFR